MKISKETLEVKLLLDNIEVQKILTGEKQVYSKVVEAFEQDLYVFVKAFNIDEQAVKTLVKDSFIYTYNQLNYYKEAEIFSEWFAATTFSYLYKELKHNMKMEETPIMDASYKEIFIFFLHELLQVSKLTISKAINITNQEIEVALNSTYRSFYTEELTEEKPKEGCLSSEELLQYVEKVNDEDVNSKGEDHLEFCPSCRESVFSMKSLKKAKLEGWRNQHLEKEISQTIIEELIPYKKKKRSWKYQYLAAASVIALFSIFMYVIPNVTTWVSAASNYIKYGQFHNVWGSGTYAVENSDVTFEVLHVEVSPLFLYIHYDVNEEAKDRFYNYDNYRGSLVNHWGGSVFRMKIDDGQRYDLALAEMPTLTDRENILILSIAHIEEIPDTFELEIIIRELANRRGIWDLTIPIQYAPFKDEMEFVDIDFKETFADSVEIAIEQLIKTTHGSIIEYKVGLTNEELERIEDSLPSKVNGYNTMYLDRNINPMMSIQSASGFHLIPLNLLDHYNLLSSSYPVPQSNTQKVAYSHFYYDVEELNASYETGVHNPMESIVKGVLDKDNSMHIMLEGFQYHIPVDITIPIKLQEVEDYPLNIEVNGDIFETITIKKITLDRTEYSPERFDIVLKGSKQSKLVKNIYHWNVHETEMRDGWQPIVSYTYGENNQAMESDTVGFHLQVFIDENTPELVELKSTGMQRIIHLEEPLKIPLGKKE